MSKSESKKSFFDRYFPLILIGGIVIGAIIGAVFGEKATKLKPLGDIFLNLMFTIVVPMVFVSITSAVGSMVNLKRLGKILGSTVAVFVITGLIASAFVLVTVNVFPPTANVTLPEAAEMAEAKTAGEMFVSSLTVTDFGQLLSKEHMLPLIIFAILFGLAMSICGGDESPVGKFFVNLNDIIMKVVSFIMMYAPIGLGAYFANLIGELGPELITDYGRVLIVYYPLVFVYMFVMFPIYSYYAGGKTGVKRMAKNIANPAITAFATQSSVAAIPVNKEACDKMGVPEDISNIVLPMGATMHMDGSVLSSIVKISFLFGVFDMPFTGVSTYAMAIVVSVLAAFVLSGAPGGGLVGEMLIVSLFGFPPEAFPLIATIGFLVDPAATMLNASGDAIASMIVTRIVEGKDWVKRKVGI
ncbi:dicarboxylate/amino acid:cation symporter [Miniphocaeibacter halophilus]|uniref:Dicarboxylate/amino acid:cation symporter n=1 Tax=Miniphocaeibacter halophilus TaxID=2931922 RepID=A0AC61MP01_9FIRM|nr:dicarboxylate/amino acid:cation symporter [Miniphocaeibacter halophilus]QQK07212.1 dicarboxylate/amino acid:cation symporter [Miniphocaeibacter halophilus]